MIVAIDPGMCSPGVAVFDEHAGRLICAARVKAPDDFINFPAGYRWYMVANLIRDWLNQAVVVPSSIALVFECPQWYQRGKSKGDPNQLVGIAGVAANVCGLMRPAVVKSPTPSEWIGQLPKTCRACGKNLKKCPACKGSAWATPRGQRIRSRLTDAELALVPDQNDAIDAVGLGLWALGRLTPRAVFSNGRDGR